MGGRSGFAGTERGGVGVGGAHALGASRALLPFTALPVDTWLAPSSDHPPTSTSTSDHSGPGSDMGSVWTRSTRGRPWPPNSCVSQRAPSLGASSLRTLLRVKWDDKRVPTSMRGHWSPGGQVPLPPQGQKSPRREGVAGLRQDGPPGYAAAPGAHPLSGDHTRLSGLLSHSPFSWLILSRLCQGGKVPAPGSFH